MGRVGTHASIVRFLETVPLFSGLSGEDLKRLSGLMKSLRLTAGTRLFREGDAGDRAYVIREGRIEISKTSAGKEVLLAVRGAGELIGELALLEESRRMAGARAVTDSRVLCLSKEQLNGLLSSSPTAARAMLHTVISRLRHTELSLRHSEKMAQLGALTAGVAHELNNPAAAVLRAAEQLAASLGSLRLAWQQIGGMGLGAAEIRELNRRLEKAGEPTNAGRFLQSFKRAAREEEVEAWLQERGSENLWELAPDLVDMDLQVHDLQALERIFSAAKLGGPLRLLCAYSGASSLLGEISHGASQIASIVKALKSYSYLDQAPVQLVDIHESLDSSLLMLRRKLGSAVTVVREYAPDLPRIQAYGSELNQVWTNLIDNAIDAVGKSGTIRIRTAPKEGWISVAVEDDGPGIPEEVRERLFTPFFTTKPAGVGTGQGLSISRSILQQHGGRIRFRSRPGKTVFLVRLPVDFSGTSLP